jgi:hypothetical protein
LAAVISVILIVLATTFLVIYEEHQATVKANEPIIYYSLSSTPFFFNTTGTENYIIVYYANIGKTVGDFNLIIKFVNATFSTIKEQSYTEINPASAEFPADLNAGNSTSKDVYFSIAPNVNSFSISLSIHGNQASLKTIGEYPDFLQYTWNVNDFELNQ